MNGWRGKAIALGLACVLGSAPGVALLCDAVCAGGPPVAPSAHQNQDSAPHHAAHAPEHANHHAGVAAAERSYSAAGLDASPGGGCGDRIALLHASARSIRSDSLNVLAGAYTVAVIATGRMPDLRPSSPRASPPGRTPGVAARVLRI